VEIMFKPLRFGEGWLPLDKANIEGDRRVPEAATK
jgi:hypothetical protein